MKLKSLLLIASSIPTLAFAQNNYQTQYLTGTYSSQLKQYTGVTSSQEESIPPPEAVNNNMEYRIQEAQTIKVNAAPNESTQNFNQSAPRMGK